MKGIRLWWKKPTIFCLPPNGYLSTEHTSSFRCTACPNSFSVMSGQLTPLPWHLGLSDIQATDFHRRNPPHRALKCGSWQLTSPLVLSHPLQNFLRRCMEFDSYWTEPSQQNPFHTSPTGAQVRTSIFLMPTLWQHYRLAYNCFGHIMAGMNNLSPLHIIPLCQPSNTTWILSGKTQRQITT